MATTTRSIETGHLENQGVTETLTMPSVSFPIYLEFFLVVRRLSRDESKIGLIKF